MAKPTIRERIKVWNKFRKYNFSFLPELQDDRDYVLGWSLGDIFEDTRIGTKNYVTKSDKVHIPVKIRDQKNKNTCVLEAYSMQRDENDKFGSMFSVQAGTAYLVSKGQMTDQGTSLSVAHKMKRVIGWILEDKYGTNYNLSWVNFSRNLWTPELLKEAEKYKSSGSYKTYDLNLVLENLDKGITGHTGISWFSSYNFLNKNNKVINLNNGRKVGGHSILITGYDKKTFQEPMIELATSFGEDFGDSGYFFIPLRDFAEAFVWGTYYDSDLDSGIIKWLADNKGKLIKDPNSPKIYFINGTVKKHVPDEYMWYWTKQEFREDSMITQVPEGTPFSKEDLGDAEKIMFDKLTNWIKTSPNAMDIIKKY